MPARISAILRVSLAAVALLAAAILVPAPALGRQASTPASIPAARQAANVAIITIHGPITKVTAKSIERRLKLAERSGADAVVFDIDTPGGELGAALDICNTIKKSRITNTVAWINPNAYSAGSVIALACREIVTADPATMGDALPIAIGPMGQLISLPEHEKQKATAPLLAEVVDSARRRGHDEYLVQGIVALGVELWLVEHKKTGERVCINRAEYQDLFGSPPPPLRPRLVSAPTGANTAPPPQSADPSAPPSDSASPPAETPPSNASSSPTESVPADGSAVLPPPEQASPEGEAIEFQPAGPGLESLSEEVTLGQEKVSQRPSMTASDRGQWKLVEYVSDGHGPYTFRADDLLHYRLAAAKVQNDEDLQRFFGASHLRRLDQNWSESLVVLLTNNIVRGLLIAVFLIALVMEMFHPGLILPGSVAAVALVLLVAPPLLIGMANWWEIAAIGSGILLLTIEVLVLPGFGLPGVLGIILLFVGLIGTFVGEGSGLFPNSPGGRTELLGGLVTVLTSFVSAGLAIYFISRNLTSIPVLNRMVLRPTTSSDDDEASIFEAIVPATGPVAVGDLGITLTPLRLAGKAQFGDRVLDVTSSLGYIDPGTTVRVVAADAFQIQVEPAGDQPRT
ncbi:MAG: hypothetical protein GIKADHBN_02403 [Phycisphaerales bacterium]|nr:hypothetical protein [Phycisphaerales bacterium]